MMINKFYAFDHIVTSQQLSMRTEFHQIESEVGQEYVRDAADPFY